MFNIQKFSIHDGPGIRTTVFLKGCPNSCLWCHNPESLSFVKQIELSIENCIGCGMCFEKCPNNAHSIVNGKRIYNRDKCSLCGLCTDNCFSGALTLIGNDMTIDDVVKNVLEDIQYYKNSNGGVTLSGGEPVFHNEFCIEFLKIMKEHGIHTAIQTSGAYDVSLLDNLLPYLDLVMFDIKINDENTLMKYTGIKKSMIMDNLNNINGKVDIITRTPVMKNINDNENEISKIAEISSNLDNLLYYELLPYHNLYTGKLESLGMDGVEFEEPDDDTMIQLAKKAAEFNIEVKYKDAIYKKN